VLGSLCLLQIFQPQFQLFDLPFQFLALGPKLHSLQQQSAQKSVQIPIVYLHRQLRIPRALRSPPINAFQQHRQLRPS
jgi:hypothetical protein